MLGLVRRSGLILALALGASSSASAKTYGPAGCGLGSIVMGPTNGQLFAWTTNMSFGSQFWGILFGTSNCLPSKQAVAYRKQQEFLAANLASLQKELAQGRGATVDAFIETLGCSPEVKADAKETLTEHYEDLFKAPGIDGVLDQAKSELGKATATAGRCEFLG